MIPAAIVLAVLAVFVAYEGVALHRELHSLRKENRRLVATLLAQAGDHVSAAVYQAPLYEDELDEHLLLAEKANKETLEPDYGSGLIGL